MMCPSCKAAVPTGTKPVVMMLKADGKCSMCGAELKSGMDVSMMTCPACKAEMTLCSMCAATHEKAGA